MNRNDQQVELGTVCTLVSDSYAPRPNGTYPYVGLEHITPGRIKLTNVGKETDIRSNKTRFKPGHILYGKLRPYLDKCVLIDFEGICSTDILALSTNEKLINKFAVFLMHTNNFIQYANQTTSGVNHPRTSWSAIKKFKLLLPSLNNQKKIVHILSLLQDAIENQDKLIVSVSELKKSLMQKVFTEGIYGEPQKKTKIGLIPESWDVKKISDVYIFTNKPRGLVDLPAVPFIPMEKIPVEGIRLTDYEIKPKNQISSSTYFEKGDLLLAKITPSFENGKQVIADINEEYGYGSTEIIPIKEINEVSDIRFLYYYLLIPHIRSKLAGKMEGSTGRQRLNKSVLEEELIPIPPIKVQREVSQIFLQLDEKKDKNYQKMISLQLLFISMLNQLMTNELKVEAIDLN